MWSIHRAPTPPKRRTNRHDPFTPGAKTPAGYWSNRAWEDYLQDQHLLRLSKEMKKIDPTTIKKFTENR